LRAQHTIPEVVLALLVQAELRKEVQELLKPLPQAPPAAQQKVQGTYWLCQKTPSVITPKAHPSSTPPQITRGKGLNFINVCCSGIE
jgi:hypothetical protein